jgi:L-lactate dehydrogenase complex protein LldG
MGRGLSADLFAEFEMRVKAVSGEVFRVKTPKDAASIISDLVRSTRARKVVAAPGPLQCAAGLQGVLETLGVELYTDRAWIRLHAETADMGISDVEFGIAETGSVCQDASAVEDRLVSTLPPMHVALVRSGHIVPGIAEAFEIISQVFHRGYISFITGPSRTADIERVLTIGVHGPSRFVIIAVDEGGGAG